MTLLLQIETEAEELLEFAPSRPHWSPLIARLKTLGGVYRVSVGGVGYDFYGGPFTLTTRMEK